MNRTFVLAFFVVALSASAVATRVPDVSAATAPGKLTFLAAMCSSSSSMYTRVVAGQDPTSNENGSAADPADIQAYGCSPSSGVGFFLLANSTADSLFMDEGLTQAATVSTSEAGPAGGATTVQSGTTAYVPGGVAQVRRVSLANYPTTITARAAMPVLDIQCLSDGVNSDNADGAGWNAQAIAAGGQAYCIAYLWDGVAATPTSTATATPTSAATETPTPAVTATATTASSSNATVLVRFPGLSSVHVYLHANDGVAGTAAGAQVASSTWKTDSTSITVPKGTYDIRVVNGPATTVIDAANCSTYCTVDVPLATLSVAFPGLTSAHVYAHLSDAVAGTYGAVAGSATWKDNSASLVLLRGMYDVRVVHGPTSVVLDNIDCRTATCSAAAPLATLTVNFPGLTSAHTYAHATDNAPGTYGAEDSSSTWKDNTTSLTLLQAVYDVRVVHGPMQSVFDSIDCRATTCQVDVPLAKLTVNFPGLTSAHTYAHNSDGAPGTYGSEDSSSTWKNNTTTLMLLQAVYDVRVVHGPMQSVFDNVDCRAATCQVDVPLAQLTVNFPGLTSAHSYAHKSDGAPGTYGPEDSSSTWKDNTTTLTLLQGVYDVRVVHGPMTTALDDIDCRAATCVANVPLAALTVSFPGHSSVHTYVRKDDGIASSAAGAEDQSATWKTNSANFTLLRGMYDVEMVEGSTRYIVDAVDCRGATCSASVPSLAAPTATPSPTTTGSAASPTATATVKPATLTKSFVSADDTTVTWRLEPSEAADLFAWDESATACQAFGGADCGDIAQGAAGKFNASGSGQYLLVAQPYTKDGDSCEVINVASWATSLDGERTSVKATYKCSGASTMGWGLFALFGLSAVSLAWVVQRKSQWSR